MLAPQRAGLAEALGIDQGSATVSDLPMGDALVELEAPRSREIEGFLIEDSDDGGVEIDLDPPADDVGDPETDFDANLAAFMTDAELAAVAQDLLEQIEDDRRSREEWDGLLADGIKLVGLNIEQKTWPFKGACGTFDPMMAEAGFRFQATFRGEMLPAGGPVKTQIVGIATDQRQDMATRKQAWMNLFLTQLAPEYYPDFDQMGMWLPFVGSTLKKVYQDPLLKRPVSPFITPDNFIVPYSAADLATTPRATHVINYTKRQLRQLQIEGAYLDIDLPEPEEESRKQTAVKQETDAATGLTRIIPRGSGTYQLLESHCDWEIAIGSKDKLPLPYRITIDEDSQKVLGIYRNWRPDDPMKRKRQFFVHYKFLPGFGFWGYGYAHILAGSSKSATMIMRQIIDSNTLSSFPGGVRAKGLRLEDNNLNVGPMSFPEIDTGGLPIQQVIMPMPYKQPTEVSIMLYDKVRENGRNLGNMTQIAVGEGRQDAPVGTTMALMEAAQKVESAVIKRNYAAQREELRLIADLFGEYLPDKPYPFPVPGGVQTIMRGDFLNNNDIIPVSDPNITSGTQRMMRADSVTASAAQAPQIHDLRAVYEQKYRAMGMDDAQIARILPPPQQTVPLDPLTENQNLMTGKPVTAGIEQDHDAHIQAHAPLAEQMPAAQAHIAEHMALKMRVQVEQILGMQLPPPGAKLPPQIENQIAVLVAQAMQVIKAQEPGANEPTPGQIMAEELKLKAQKLQNDMQIAQIKAGTEAYKANVGLQEKVIETDSKERVARLSAFANVADNQKAPPAFAADILR